MAKFELEREVPQPTKIKVMGVGGCGCNTVSDMFTMNIENVEFYAINTDVQSLKICECPNKLLIGKELTNGLGAGSNPEVGEQSALAAKEEIINILQGADMVFISAGLGKGTGTGAAPVVAQIAKEIGSLTVAVVTRPFRFEGPQRMKRAEEGLEKLRQICDTLIVISNERLIEVVGTKSEMLEAFHIANNVLAQGVQSISELISQPGLINVDFSDVRTVMGISGGAVMGVGIGKGENRAIEAVKKACSNPLLDKIVIEGAKGILICITGPRDITLQEINEATTLVYEVADEDANIIFGAVVSDNIKDEVKVTIIATGFQEEPRKISSLKKQPFVSVEPTEASRPKKGITVNREDDLKIVELSKHEEKPALHTHTPKIEIKSDIFEEALKEKVQAHLDELEPVASETDDEQSTNGGNGDGNKEDKKPGEYEIPAIFRRRRLIF